MLSLTLARLYEDYGDGVIGVAEYEAMGGMRRVVESEIDSLLAADPVERGAQLDRLRHAFIPWLATVDPASGEPLRRVARWFELPGESHPLIEALISKRLLIKDQRGGEVVVEVALESLLRQWDTLAGWLREDASDLKETAVVEQAARAWEANGRHDDWLLPGARLAEAETLAAKPGFRDRLNAAREYLLASRQQAERSAEAGLRAAQERQEAAEALAQSEQRAKVEAEQHARVLVRRTRVLRAALALVVAVALAAVFGFGWAWKAQRTADARAHDAAAESMYANSQLILNGLYPGENHDELGMQLLLAGRAIGPQHQSADYQLLSALQQKRDLLKVIDTDATVAHVAFSPDGRRLVSAGFDGAVRQWDSGSGQPIGAPMHHDKEVLSVAYSRDGSRIVSGGIDATVRSGMPPLGRLSASRYGTSVSCQVWRSARTPPVSSRAAWTARSGSGTPPPEHRSGSRCTTMQRCGL